MLVASVLVELSTLLPPSPVHVPIRLIPWRTALGSPDLGALLLGSAGNSYVLTTSPSSSSTIIYEYVSDLIEST